MNIFFTALEIFFYSFSRYLFRTDCFETLIVIKKKNHMQFFILGGGGGRAEIAASSGWRVCHPLGTLRLVLIQTTIVIYCNFIDIVENLKSATNFRLSKISTVYILEIRTFIIHTFAIYPLIIQMTDTLRFVQEGESTVYRENNLIKKIYKGF